MRYRFLVSCIAVLLVATLNAQTLDRSQLVGKWKLNVAKSWFQNAPQPLESILVVSEANTVRFKWEVTTTFPYGHHSIMGFDGAVDGKPYQYKGAQRGTQLSFVEENGILKGTVTYSGGATVRSEQTIFPDGNTMTAQCSMTSSSTTATWVEVWERVPDKEKKK